MPPTRCGRAAPARRGGGEVRACASCRARHAGVDINQVGVPVDINQIPPALLTASAFNHLETATRCCSRARRRSAWGMAWPHEVAEGQAVLADRAAL